MRVGLYGVSLCSLMPSVLALVASVNSVIFIPTKKPQQQHNIGADNLAVKE